MFEVTGWPVATAGADAVVVRGPDGVSIEMADSVPLWAIDAVIADLQRAIGDPGSPDRIELPAGQGTLNAAQSPITLRDTRSRITPRIAMAATAEAGVAAIIISSDVPQADDEFATQSLDDPPLWFCGAAEDLGLDHVALEEI